MKKYIYILPFALPVLLALIPVSLAHADTPAKVTANPAMPTDPPNYLYNQAVQLTFTEANPVPKPTACCSSGDWTLESKTYAWTGDVKGTPGNSATTDLDTETKKGDVSATCTITYKYKCGTETSDVTDQATFNGKTGCPKQTATAKNAKCGAKYGADIEFCYTNTTGWWFKEKVVLGNPANCAVGGINQTSNPFQATGGCVSDDVSNTNGPPVNVADCTDVTNQTIYCGPTKARVEDCSYSNTQKIVVKKTGNGPPATGTVTTSSAGASTSCNW